MLRNPNRHVLFANAVIILCFEAIYVELIYKCVLYFIFVSVQISSIRHDVYHRCLVTQCQGINAMLFQFWSLPQLDLLYKVYTPLDVTEYARVVSSLYISLYLVI